MSGEAAAPKPVVAAGAGYGVRTAQSQPSGVGVVRRESGALEREVLACLAAHGEPMSPSDVQNELPDDLAYTTVMTTLARMHAKRALIRVARGRGYAYALPDDLETAQASMTAFHMQRLLDRDDDRAGVLAQFVANLESDDEQLLQHLLRKTRDGADTPAEDAPKRRKRRRP